MVLYMCVCVCMCVHVQGMMYTYVPTHVQVSLSLAQEFKVVHNTYTRVHLHSNSSTIVQRPQ